jgi:hypothetical protein
MSRSTLTAMLLALGTAAPGSNPPALPRETVDTSLPASHGAVLAVKAGEDLEHVLSLARPGDIVALQAGAVFRGPITLPVKPPGSDWIVVRSDAPDSALPPPGTRVDPSRAPALAVIEAAAGSALRTSAGAHHFRFIGLEIRPAAGVALLNLVELGGGETSLDAVPHHLIFDRCYIHGDPAKGTRRGIALNSAYTAVVDSFLADFKEEAGEAQAIAGWEGPGPFRIENNYLEGATENILFGGADPVIRDLVPSDIEVRHNHITKPLAWKKGDSAYEGGGWVVKNLFELKNARRVLVDGNVLENNWADGQTGYAVLFTVRNQDGTAPWSSVEDVTFSNNLVKGTGSGINILGTDDNHPSGRAQRIAIRNNLFLDVGGPRWGGGGTFLQILQGAPDVTVAHNTVIQTGNVITAEGTPHQSFLFVDNIAPANAYGITGTGTPSGLRTLEAYFPAASVRRNVIPGGNASVYPKDNFFPASLDDVGFVARQGDDYRLIDKSPYRRAATDGKDVGVDMDALQSATSGAASAVPPPRTPVNRRPAGAVEPVPHGGVSLVAVVFWAAVGLVGYTLVGYPLLMALWARLGGRSHRRWGPRTVPFRRPGGRPPFVSVVVVAQDEAPRIGARIENLLSLDYPRESLEILIASDGSRDATVEIAREYAPLGVQVLAFHARRGKPAVLNEVVPRARGEIVLLADARQRFAPVALRVLVDAFRDPAVGAVSGELELLDGPSGSGVAGGVGFYWRYEKCIRRWESAVDSTVGATGAIYAIRKALFEPLPEDTLLDDVLIPVRIAARGYRVLFEGRAKAFDRPPDRAAYEMRRKIRTIAGTFQLVARHPWVVSPWRTRLWLQTLSHKGLRLLLPVAFVAALLSSLALAHRPVYRLVIAAQAVFYGLALLGCALRHARVRVPLLTAPYVVCLLNWATVVAFVRYVRGRQAVTWERAAASHRPVDAVDGVPF